MAETRSEGVQHGLRYWVDYDRAWLYREIFLHLLTLGMTNSLYTIIQGLNSL
jgi:hypothetical protein